MTEILIAADRLWKSFRQPRSKSVVHAVRDVSLEITLGEKLGLVGESGCGKSTLGRMLAGITEPSSGTVTLAGSPLRAGGRKITTRVQTVFQDPFASLDPRMTVGDAVAEGPQAHRRIRAGEAKAFSRRWLERVGLNGGYVARYPHQLSGGQRQRVAIARALAMAPDVLVCDEPIASLDVSVQAQILNLFLALGRDAGLTMLFISHDLAAVRHLCDRIAVMYLGRIVEIGAAADVYGSPRHPYTSALIAAIPKLQGGVASFTPISGEVPSPACPPPGCPFHPRCGGAVERCRTELPVLRPIAAGHESACHRAEEAGSGLPT